VPDLALFGIHAMRAIRSLSFSGRRLSGYPVYVRALAMVKRAAARANHDAGVLDARVGRAIDRACAALIGGRHLEQFAVDVLAGGGSIAVNMNLNEVIANLANQSLGARRGAGRPVHPKTHVNASQSTADVCHTANRVAAIELWRALDVSLRRCATALRGKARAFAPIVTLARTSLRDAMPVRLGAMFGAHASALARRADELAQSVRALHAVNLGGTVIGSGAGAPTGYRRAVLKHLNRITGRRFTLRADLYDAAQHIDDLAAVAVQLGLTAETLIIIAQDLRMLSSGPRGGFGEIVLPAVIEGSSFFPGKINPVVPETMIQCCFQVLGCERAIRLALERGEANLNVFEGFATINLFDAISMLTRAVTLFTDRCLKRIAADVSRCRTLAAYVNKA
jgi:aspartate ammonia-lyase